LKVERCDRNGPGLRMALRGRSEHSPAIAQRHRVKPHPDIRRSGISTGLAKPCGF
jgi:hypothetical protein